MHRPRDLRLFAGNLVAYSDSEFLDQLKSARDKLVDQLASSPAQEYTDGQVQVTRMKLQALQEQIEIYERRVAEAGGDRVRVMLADVRRRPS